MKICIVSSPGGHLGEVRMLKRAYEPYEHFFVLNDRVSLPDDMKGRTLFVRHAARDLGILLTFWQAWRILRRARPDVILSAGASPAVPFALAGKLLGIKTIFVEISAQVTTPSLTGRLMYYLADGFFYQWEPLRRYFPRGTFGGPIAWSS